jgi:hypothetical protein
MTDIVWTNHLNQRLSQRGISRNEVYDAINHPDSEIRQSNDTWKFIKKFSNKKVGVVAVNKSGKWVILTAYTKNPRYKGKSYKEPLISRFVRSLLVKAVNSIQYLIFHRRH